MKIDWYTGVCDSLLQRIAWWVAAWDRGDAFATRDMVNLKAHGGVEPVVVKRVVKLPISRMELEHLVRILKAAQPDGEMTNVFTRSLGGFDHCKMLPGNLYLLPIASYKIEAEETFQLLAEIRDGKYQQTSELDQKIASGDRLWG